MFINLRIVMGYVPQPPEIKDTVHGFIMRFHVAIYQQYFERGIKHRKAQTIWEEVEAYDDAAQYVRDYVKKGNLVYVEGEYASGNDKRETPYVNSFPGVIKIFNPYEVLIINSKTK